MTRERPGLPLRSRFALGAGALFVLAAAVAAMSTGPDARAEDKSSRQDEAEKARLQKWVSKLHQEGWDRQKALFTWPRGSARLKTIGEKGLRFGADLRDILPEGFDELRKPEVYSAEYSSLRKGASGPGTGMADLLAPTQFRGGWQNVLRHVNDFGQLAITKEQAWLLMEDMWVQRSVLSGLRAVNFDMARFELVRADPAAGAKDQNKTKRLFRNRTWELALEIVPAAGRERLTGTLTNITDRLQVLGVGNKMTLNVWLSDEPGAVPFKFEIGGEFVPGKGSTRIVQNQDGNTQVVPANVLEIVPREDHTLPPGFLPARPELARVEQVFDARTVPVKRIDALVIGHPAALDARNAVRAGGLLPPLSTANGGLFPEAFVKEADAPGAIPPGAPGPGDLPPGGGLATKPVGGGPLLAVIDANKKRYLEVSPQVRRMPVAVVVVVDQTHVQDVLLGLANTPLRFQITQVALTRFRGALEAVAATDSGGAGARVEMSGPGIIGSGLRNPESRSPARPPFGPGPIGPGASPFGPPMGPGAPPLPAASGTADAHVVGGLVELSVYGVVSLFEKFDDAKPAASDLVLAGYLEQYNWPRFTEVLVASLPRPGEAKDGGNLTEVGTRVNDSRDVPPVDQVRLWKGQGQAGEQAHEWFRRRLAEGVPIERAVEDANSRHRENLAMVNVETVHTRWVSDASAFLKAADAQVNDRFGNAIADWMTDAEREKDEGKNRWKPKASEGGAWVVEIRGYTDHKAGRRFVEQSVLRNLQRLDSFAGTTKPARSVPGVLDPVKGKVSHPFVYAVWPDFAPQPGVLLNIGAGKSYLDGLLAFGDEMNPRKDARGPAWRGLGGTGGAAALPVFVRRPDDSTKTRFEFVVMALWREPVAPAPLAP